MEDKNINNDDDFIFVGLPSNEPFEVEVPDTERRAISRAKSDMKAQLERELKNIDVNQLINQLPPDKLAELQKDADANGISLEDAFKQSLNIINDVISSSDSIDNLFADLEKSINEMFSHMGMGGGEDDDTQEQVSEGEAYSLDNTSYLRPNDFGSITCLESDKLFDEFIEKFGSDSTKYLDGTVGIESYKYNDVTIKLTQYPIRALKYITSTNRFILFYADPVDSSKYGYFMVVVKDGDGKFTAFIPEYGNTYKISASDDASLFSPATDPQYFMVDSTGAKFIRLNLTRLLFSAQYYLAPHKNVILNPKKFGTIKNVMAPVTKASCMLKIGNIISNESPEAILLKKDADLPLDETTFPLYIHFGCTIGEDSLKIIQEVLFKVDFNNCELFDNCELKWTQDNRLYVEVDLGEF